ncbi:hypothetical protein [Streptomyces sp. 7N604]|uniref:hypothetical protein n=1 Tax=Streptomyces sp. 7N604 TaxID=3457415 RepID=UPI003FD5F8FF
MSEGGYRVTGSAQPEALEVRWMAPDDQATPSAVVDAELRSCAEALQQAGWQVTMHTEYRTAEPLLLASPRRA